MEESIFIKLTEESCAFCNSVENCNTCNGMFRKAALLEISSSPLLTGVAGSQYTVCSATKSELRSALKLTENVQEVISHGFPFQ